MRIRQHLNIQGQMSFMKKTSLVIRLILIAGCIAQIHCAQPPQPPPGPPPLQTPRTSSEPQVSAILQAFREVVRTIQSGQLVSHFNGMQLFSGNRIEVYSGGWAQLYFPATGTAELFASEITNNTCKVKILSPSIFIEIGLVHIDVTNEFEFQTKFLINNTKNAKSRIIVYPNDKVRISVYRESVTVRPKSGAWDPVIVPQGYYMDIEGDQPPTPRLQIGYFQGKQDHKV